MKWTGTVRELTPQDSELFPEGVELLNRTQGRDLFAPDYLSSKVKNENVIVVGAFQAANVLGIGVAEIITEFDYYLPFVPDLTQQLAGKTVGSFSTMAILESFQGRGIGQQLSHIRLNWLKLKKCDVVLGVSWVSGLLHTSNRVFEKMNFKAVKRVDHFYRQSSIDKPFFCPGCQLAPCTCSAILYRWDIATRE